MLRAALILTLTAVGCQKPAPVLIIQGVAFSDAARPTVITLRVANEGNLAAELTDCEAAVGWSFLLTGKPDNAPPRFDYDFELTSAPVAIEPGGTIDVKIVGTWEIGSDEPMSAICHATFLLADPRGGRLRAGPATFLLNAAQAYEIKSPGDQLELQQELRELPGAKSDGVRRIIDLIDDFYRGIPTKIISAGP